MYAHLPLLFFGAGGIILFITQYRHWLGTLSVAIFIGAVVITSSLTMYRSVLIANFEKEIQQSIQQCSPILKNDIIVLVGGLCRIGQVPAYFNHGLSEKISFQNAGNYDNTVCKSYGSIALDGTNPLIEVVYRFHQDTITLVTMDAGSSLVPNLTDRFQSVTYNEDSSIVYYPRKFLPFRRSAPRECAVIFNSAKIAPSAKIVFLYRGHYYMRTLGQFKEELVSGLWQ